jgi:hypothetical protein
MTGFENLDVKEEEEKENDGIDKDGDYADPASNFLIASQAPQTKR